MSPLQSLPKSTESCDKKCVFVYFEQIPLYPTVTGLPFFDIFNFFPGLSGVGLDKSGQSGFIARNSFGVPTTITYSL